ncbi:MAG: PilZ domain-containing protein [Candidatus Omnitrophica bacterium]|nr:PilZ domain-containing protein [Candidatus Omnitrophota bacterium]
MRSSTALSKAFLVSALCLAAVMVFVPSVLSAKESTEHLTTRIQIRTSDPAQFEVQRLNNPPRLALGFTGAPVFSGLPEKTEVNKGNLISVDVIYGKTVEGSTVKPMQSLILTLIDHAPYEVTQDGNLISIAVGSPEGSSARLAVGEMQISAQTSAGAAGRRQAMDQALDAVEGRISGASAGIPMSGAASKVQFTRKAVSPVIVKGDLYGLATQEEISALQNGIWKAVTSPMGFIRLVPREYHETIAWINKRLISFSTIASEPMFALAVVLSLLGLILLWRDYQQTLLEKEFASDPIDRRIESRADLNYFGERCVLYPPMSGNGEEKINVLVRNISAGGIAFDVDNQIEVPEKVNGDLSLLGYRSPIHFSAARVWVRGGGETRKRIGIHFTDIAPSSRRDIRRYVRGRVGSTFTQPMGKTEPGSSDGLFDNGNRKIQTTLEVRLASASSVSVAGDFNGWDARSLPLTRTEDGVWKTVLELEPGSYQYRLLVDGQWMNDPNCQNRTINEFGTENCLIEVGHELSV